MEEPSSEIPAKQREKWRLSQQSFDQLLAWLDPDRELAGKQYEIMRRKLIDLFRWRGCDCGDELADEAIDRLAKKVAEGVEIANRSSFLYGIFSYVLKERWKSRPEAPAALVPLTIFEDGRLRYLRQCVSQLTPADRALFEQYYYESAGIRDRKQLAAKHQCTVNALRLRVHRIRNEVAQCVRRCAASGG